MTKTRQTVLFIAKKQKSLCHFAHVVIPGRCETHKRMKQRNYKNCAKKNFFAVENKFTETVECLFFYPSLKRKLTIGISVIQHILKHKSGRALEKLVLQITV